MRNPNPITLNGIFLPEFTSRIVGILIGKSLHGIFIGD